MSTKFSGPERSSPRRGLEMVVFVLRRQLSCCCHVCEPDGRPCTKTFIICIFVVIIKELRHVSDVKAILLVLHQREDVSARLHIHASARD